MKFILLLFVCVLIEFQVRDVNAATWNDFKSRHVVATDPGKAAAWNTLLKTRIGSQYGKKTINSFVVNAESVIQKNFPATVPQYKGGSASNLFWSSTTQHIFVLKLGGTKKAPTYNVFDCGKMWYVAGLNMTTRQPVHYQGHARTQGPKLGPITDNLCKQVK